MFVFRMKIWKIEEFLFLMRYRKRILYFWRRNESK